MALARLMDHIQPHEGRGDIWLWGLCVYVTDAHVRYSALIQGSDVGNGTFKGLAGGTTPAVYNAQF